MANTDFFLESLTEVKAPEVTVESVTFSFKTALDANLASDNDPFQKPQKFINARMKLKIFDNYNPNTGRGYWKNSPILSKYLKYKVIASIDRTETARILQNTYEINKLGGNEVKTITLDDFKLEKTQQFNVTSRTPFYTYYEINIQKEKVSDFIRNLSLIIVPYLDPQEVCKDFNITLENVVDVDKFFFATPILINDFVTTRVQASGGTFIETPSNIIIVDLTSIENLKQDFYLPLKLKSVPIYKNYFSDLFATDDFLNFSVGTIQNSQVPSSGLATKRIIRFGFFFDKLRFAKENSAFPQLFSSAVPKEIKEFLEAEVKTLKLSIIRKRKDRLTQNLGFEEEVIAEDISAMPANNLNGFIIGPKKIAGIEKVDFYSGIDINISDKTDGQYTYVAKIKVFDPTYKIVNKIRGDLLQSIRIINIYKSIMDQPIIQYQEAKDVNPYIDINDANQTYNFKNYGYNSVENRYVLDIENIQSSKNFLTNIINGFIEVHKILNTDLNFTDGDYEKLKNTLLFISLPPTGNPEGSQLLLELLQEVVNSLNSILASSSPASSIETEGYRAPDEPNAFKELAIEKEFTNFTADAEIVKNFCLNYHNTNKTTESGLLFIPNVQNQFSDPFDTALKQTSGVGLERFKSLKEVYLPTKNLFLTIPIIKSNQSIDSELALNVDTILTLSKTQNIESIISAYDTALLLNKVKSKEEAQSAFKDIVFGGFNVLVANNIMVTNPQYFKLSRNDTDLVSGNALKNPIEELKKKTLSLYNEVIFKMLSLGLLNFTELTENTALIDKQYQNLFNRTIYLFNFDSRYIDVKTSRLMTSSALKLINNTYKKATFLSFQLVDETSKNNANSNIQYDKYYNLKDPVFKNISLVGASIKNDEILLGYLSDYIDPANYLYEQPYSNVPIINKYFMFNKSLINASLTEEQTTINEVAQAASAISAPGTITGVVATAEVLTQEEQTTINETTQAVSAISAPGTITGVAVTVQVQTPQTEVQQTAETARATTAGKQTAFSQALNSGLSKKL